MKRNRLRSLAACGAFVWICLFPKVPGAASRAQAEEAPAPPPLPIQPTPSATEAEVARTQKDLKEILDEIRRRMEDLQEKLKDKQPEDAKRLDEAAKQIRTSKLPDELMLILENLRNEKFFAALNLQDSVLRKLDDVIRILEARRFGKEGELEKKLDEASRFRKAISAVRRGQEDLLKKTRDFLKEFSEAFDLKDLGRKVEELEKAQEALRDGAEGEARERGSEDSLDLEKAKDQVEALRRDQDDLNEKMGALRGQSGAREGPSKEVKDRLETLRSGIADLEKLMAETRKSAGRGSPSGAGEKSEKKEGGEGSGGKPGDREIPPGERERLGKMAEGLSEKLSDLSKSISPRKSGDPVPEKLAAAGSRVGESREAIEKGDGGKALGSQEKAREALKEAEKELAGGGESPGETGERPPEEKTAREDAAREAAARQEKISGEAGRLAEDLRAKASRAGSPKAQEGLEGGARSLEEARSAMEKARDSLAKAGQGSPSSKEASGKEGGDPSKASEAGREASEKLKGAAEALSKSLRDLAARSKEEKAADLQRKLARKTEEAAKEAERLERKLREKSQGSLGAAKESLSRAARSMGESAGARGAGRSEEAKAKAQDALERLRKAKEDLAREEKDQLARMDRQKLKDMAREEERLKEMTRRLAQEMAGSQDSAQRSKSVEKAAGKMGDAQENLDQGSADTAEKDEEEALAKLQESEEAARREEERLARLRQEQTLVNIQKELEEVKGEQEKINLFVIDLDQKRGRAARPSRFIQLKLKDHSQSEAKLAERVTGLVAKVEEEIARVFAFVLRSIGADMKQLSDALAESETGKPVQFLGQDIVKELERLLESLRQIKPPPPGEGEPMPGRRRLVPGVAELIVLKDLQVEVNRRTKELEIQREASKSEIWNRSIRRLAQKQGSLTDMTRKISEDLEGTPGDEEEEGGKEEKKVGPSGGSGEKKEGAKLKMEGKDGGKPDGQ